VVAMLQFKKYLKRVSKVINGPSSYTAGGFVVTIGELRKVVYADVKYIGSGEYIAQVVTKAQDGTLKDNQIKIVVRDNIEQTVNEGGSDTYTIGGEVADGTDLSSLQFLVIAEGY